MLIGSVDLNSSKSILDGYLRSITDSRGRWQWTGDIVIVNKSTGVNADTQLEKNRKLIDRENNNLWVSLTELALPLCPPCNITLCSSGNGISLWNSYVESLFSWNSSANSNLTHILPAKLNSSSKSGSHWVEHWELKERTSESLTVAWPIILLFIFFKYKLNKRHHMSK